MSLPEIASPAPGAGDAWDTAALRRLQRVCLGLGAAFVAAAILGVVGIVPPLHQTVAATLMSSKLFVFAMAGALVIQAAGTPRRYLALTLLVGPGLGVVAWRFGLCDGLLTAAVWGFGGAAFVAVALRAARHRDARSRALLLATLVLPAFVLVSITYLRLSAAIRPTVLDVYVYAVDAAFGTQLSFVVGRFFAAYPAVAFASRVIYEALPLALAFIFALQARRRDERLPDSITAFATAAVAGYAIYMVFPVVGPIYVLGSTFPYSPPAPPDVPTSILALPVARNCMPSLHTTWALLAFWHSRGLFWARPVAGIFLIATLAATLGLGLHYAVDLVAAFPFALVIQAAVAPRLPQTARWRWFGVVVGVALTLLWTALIGFAAGARWLGPWVVWTLATLSIVLACWLERRLFITARDAPRTAVVRPAERPRVPLGLAAIFFTSGFAALCYEVVFAKSFGQTFGSTARAATTVLAAYLAGLALGSWIGGRLAHRVTSPVRAYALAEAAIAGWCALSPLLTSGLQRLYVAGATGVDPSSSWLVPLQLSLGCAVLVPATLFMGVTTPLLAKHVVDRDPGLGRAVAMLYGANTLGAGAGAIVAGYVLLPAAGIVGTTFLAVALNLVVVLAALRLAQRDDTVPGAAGPGEIVMDPVRLPRAVGFAALLILTLGGFVTLALENAYIHLLAVVAGNSVYAFALMVFCFLVGLAAGAWACRHLLAASVPSPLLVVLAELALALSVLLGTYLWDALPAYFASFELYPLTRTFGAREFIRFLACSMTMIPAAFFIGVAYPAAMDCVARASRDLPVRAMGRAGALNTIGNVAGAVVGSFVLLPRLGSLGTLRVLAGITIILAAVPTLVVRARWRPLAFAGMGVCVLALVLSPRTLDPDDLASGANVYFARQHYGKVIDQAESIDGGLTSVAESFDSEGTRVLTMLTNGKFQGDDNGYRELNAQVGFTLFPLLHLRERGRALIIGLGTGVSARVAVEAGFARVDVAELSRDVVAMARRYFGRINHGVLDRPNVHTFITDGRNLLLLSRDVYDLVGIEVTSIWFAGAANLYNREFYQIARRRLTPHGVLQQWMQFHRLSVTDLISIVATVRSEFERVWLYHSQSQGVIVACNADCRPTRETLAELDRTPALAESIAVMGGRASAMLERRLMAPHDVDRWLADMAAHGYGPHVAVSTDDNLRLEYSTPRGNVRDYAASFRESMDFVRRYATSDPLAETRLSPADLGEPGRIAAPGR